MHHPPRYSQDNRRAKTEPFQLPRRPGIAIPHQFRRVQLADKRHASLRGGQDGYYMQQGDLGLQFVTPRRWCLFRITFFLLLFVVVVVCRLIILIQQLGA